MSSLVRKLLVQTVLVLAVSVVSVVIVSAQAPRRPPHQSADAFVGTWILNLAKSTFEGLPPPKSGMRTFDYERDGMILTTAHSEDAKGRPSFVHYLFTLDGTEYEEVTRTSSSAAGERTPTFVSARKVHDRTIDVTFKRDGKVIISHSWSVSDDGKTFTVKRRGTNAQGQPTYSLMVYEKQ